MAPPSPPPAGALSGCATGHPSQHREAGAGPGFRCSVHRALAKSGECPWDGTIWSQGVFMGRTFQNVRLKARVFVLAPPNVSVTPQPVSSGSHREKLCSPWEGPRGQPVGPGRPQGSQCVCTAHAASTSSQAACPSRTRKSRRIVVTSALPGGQGRHVASRVKRTSPRSRLTFTASHLGRAALCSCPTGPAGPLPGGCSRMLHGAVWPFCSETPCADISHLLVLAALSASPRC